MGGLVITEIMNDPSTTSNAEWFEVLNTSSFAVNLLGLQVTNSGGSFTVTSNLTVPSGQLVVFVRKLSSAGFSVVPPLYYEYGSSINLSSSTDTLRLRNSATIDSVTYNDANFPDLTNYSMSLLASASTATANDVGSNWCLVPTIYAAGPGFRGSPGVVNPACIPRVQDLVAGDLVITELMVNPDAIDDGDGEWIEFRVDKPGGVDLRGLIVRSWIQDDPMVDEQFIVDKHRIVDHKAYAVLAIEDDPAQNGNVPAIWDWSGINLYNKDDSLQLRSATTLIDEVIWDNGLTFPDARGVTMSLNNDLSNASDNDLGSSWCDGRVLWPGSAGDLGTPGEANPENAAEIEGNGIDEDCDGRDALIGLNTLLPGDLIITEIHMNPDGVSDSNGEWFEVHNQSGVNLDLRHLRYHSGGTQYVVNERLYVPAGGYAVLGNEPDFAINGNVYVDFETLASLSNSSNTLSIAAPNGTVFHSVSYDNGATFPDPNGSSIQLDPADFTTQCGGVPCRDLGASWCIGRTLFPDPDPLDSLVVLPHDFGSPGAANHSCALQLDFTFRYDIPGTPDLINTTWVNIDRAGNFVTGNLGDGVNAGLSSTGSGQEITWTYNNTGVTYTGLRPFGSDSFSGTMVNIPAFYNGPLTSWTGALDE